MVSLESAARNAAAAEIIRKRAPIAWLEEVEEDRVVAALSFGYTQFSEAYNRHLKSLRETGKSK